MAFDDAFLSELRQRCDIEGIVSSYVTLKRKGRLLGGLCPFHNEKTPSFYVYPETQSYYCFGCGNGGDVVTFIKNIENLDYVEAVKFLCDKCGMSLPEDNYDNGLSRRRMRMYEANREAARFYYKMLFSNEGKIAREYCNYRQLTKETVKKFGIGYAPEGWSALREHLNQLGFTDNELYEANLLGKSQKGNYYDRFVNRLMFPIIDVRGNVVAFSGRRLNEEDKAKYVNSADTLVYKKGREIFALNHARKTNTDTLILCEGNIDVVMLHQAGFTNAVAALGTALTQDQAQVLSRYASEILICYDSDEAGQKAVQKALGIFANTTLKTKVINMQGGKDPDEIIKKFGPERFRELIEKASNDTEYKLMRQREKYSLSTADGKVGFMQDAAKVLARVSSPIEVDIYASKLADELSVRKEAIMSEIAKNRKALSRIEKTEQMKEVQKSLDNRKDVINIVNAQRPDNLHAASAEETLIASLINNPSYYKQLKDEVSKDDFVTDFNRKVFSVLTERLSEGKPIDLSFLTPYFSDDEMSAVARIATMTQNLSNSVNECLDCIRVIKQEKDKSAYSNPSELSDKDFLNIFKDRTKSNDDV